jgi:hypothetical protein
VFVSVSVIDAWQNIAASTNEWIATYVGSKAEAFGQLHMLFHRADVALEAATAGGGAEQVAEGGAGIRGGGAVRKTST